MKMLPKVYQPEFLSTKTITEHVVSSPAADELGMMGWDQFIQEQPDETAHILRLTEEFKNITEHFISLARKS